MTSWNISAPAPTESMILQAVGNAMLFPADSGYWRTVFSWCERNRQNPISKSIIKGFVDAGGNLDEAFELGDDPGQQRKEPRWLTTAFATAEGGDVNSNLARRLEKRRQAAHRRAVERWDEVRS